MKQFVLNSIAALAIVAPVAGLATTFQDVRVNKPQIHGDANSDANARFPVNAQSEPTIAVNPTNPLRLIAGANDNQTGSPCWEGYCGSYWNDGKSGVYTSSDGGASWTNRGILSDNPAWQNSPFYSIGDPVLAYGPKPAGSSFSYNFGARAYYATLAVYKYGLSPYASTPFKSVVAVSYSDDDGATWSAPVVVESRDNAVNFSDKEWIGVDNSPASPYFGRVYVSWSDFRAKDNINSEPVMMAVSGNGGASFGKSLQLSNASNPAGPANGRQDTVITTGPDGAVYAVWADASSVMITKSQNGGTSFSKPRAIGTFNQIDDPIPGATFRTGDPDLELRLGVTFAADPRLGSSTLYAGWVTKTPSGARLMVSTSTSRGAKWGAPVSVTTAAEGYAFFPSIDVAPTGRVDIGYLALKALDPGTVGTGNATIDAFYVQKPVGGGWSAPLKVTTVASDPAVSSQGGRARQFWGDYTTIRSGANKAWYVYTDGRNGAGCPAVDNYQLGLTDVVPNPPVDCPGQFGNTDIFVSIIQP